MRTSTLQYLYLQKPVSTLIFVCLISVCWIATGDFFVKVGSDDAIAAASILESGDWVLPRIHANEFAYKPPMAQWMMAVASMPQGYVSEFTTRLPSALAYTALMAFLLVFFGRKVRFQEAFIASLLLLTSIGMHCASMSAQVDMLLTAFIVVGLIQLFRWEYNLELKGLPLIIPLMLSGAILTKGLVGIVLPLFIFGVYLLMLRRYRLRKIIKSLVYIGLASLFIPSLWYIEAWRQGGNSFLNMTIIENFGRFFSVYSDSSLCVEKGAWYNPVSLIKGFLPWTILLFFSLFGLKTGKPQTSVTEGLKKCWNAILSMDKTKLFSLVAIVCIVFFYSIPGNKRSLYLLPAYPFIALFMSQYIICLTERRSKVTRVFAGTLAVINLCVISITLLNMTGAVDFNHIAQSFTANASILETVNVITTVLTPTLRNISLLALLSFAFLTVCYQMKKKINIKMLYASIFLVFCTHFFLDGTRILFLINN
ncbi:MAG: glycosyltransferase family 39 protein [Tannerella sp.]|jgi:4-amino-4-deoxy-L-arabinose transferase-like glycosyltransferase|nr:glycosyltransferase family 39 protein [Tannerella sp.]